jgi:hypothetical protein
MAHVIAIDTATSRRRVGWSGLLQLRVPRLGFLEDVKWAIYQSIRRSIETSESGVS